MKKHPCPIISLKNDNAHLLSAALGGIPFTIPPRPELLGPALCPAALAYPGLFRLPMEIFLTATPWSLRPARNRKNLHAQPGAALIFKPRPGGCTEPLKCWRVIRTSSCPRAFLGTVLGALYARYPEM